MRMKTIYERYADLLVRYSLDLQKGDKLLIVSTPLAEPLVHEVFRAALRTGAHPETWITLAGLGRTLYDEGSEEQLSYVSPMYLHAVAEYQAFLTIRAPYNVKELQGVDPARKKTASVAEAPMRKLYRERAASGSLKWTLCEFPTESQAQECGLSRRDYESFVFSACLLDEEDPAASWRAVHDRQQRFVDFLNGRSRIRYSGPDVDISFSTEGRRWINSDGRHNMPSGEVYTSPVEESVEGHIRFSYPGVYMGQEIEDVRLEVRKGKITNWQAAKGQELLDQILEVPGADRFGEAAIGTNKGITRFTRNMLFDEKIGGTVHLALGASYAETGGKNESAIHWDLLADMRDRGEIYADGELVYRNGDFLI
jgi:aminopeptidase